MGKYQVKELLDKNSQTQLKVLQDLNLATRAELIEQLCEDFFVTHRAMLAKWGLLTGQSSQIDTGYIAQHIASLVLQQPGQGFKGKGDDLADASEVKAASSLAGVDRARWNHNFGTGNAEAAAREKAEASNKPYTPKWMRYREAPAIFYVLLDRVNIDTMRLRSWCVRPEADEHWTALLEHFIESYGEDEGQRSMTTERNLQLHPPIGRDDNVVVNSLQNLDFSQVLVFDARFPANPKHAFALDWEKELTDEWQVGVCTQTETAPEAENKLQPDVQELDRAEVFHLFGLYTTDAEAEDEVDPLENVEER